MKRKTKIQKYNIRYPESYHSSTRPIQEAPTKSSEYDDQRVHRNDRLYHLTTTFFSCVKQHDLLNDYYFEGFFDALSCSHYQRRLLAFATWQG